MCRVLIADDEPKVLLLIKNLIEWDELGLELVATANDGLSALSAIADVGPDIVITDIRMPGCDGIELIGRAKELNPAIDFIIISGYRHFDYAQKAIRFGVEDYLLKPLKAAEINQTLRKMMAKHQGRELAREREAQYTERLEKDARRLHTEFVAKALGFRGNDEALDRNLEAINSDFSVALRPAEFQSFVVKADVGSGSFGPSVRKLLDEKISVSVRDAVRAHSHACLLYPSERGVFGLLNFDESQKKALRKCMVAVIDDLQSQSEIFDRIKVSIGLGRQSDDLREMRVSAQEAESAMLNRWVLGTGRVLERPTADNCDIVVAKAFSSETRKRLLQSIEILDVPGVVAAIDEIARGASAIEGVTGKAIMAVFEECAQLLGFGLKARNAVDSHVDALQVATMEKLGMCNTQREVFLLLRTFVSDVIAYVAESKRNEGARPVRDAQRLIQASFAEPLGLESISERIGLSPTYFSAVFKKETGFTFLEYLTDVRVREAKRLLADPRKTIADVAIEVGYSDVKHFSRVFARSTGIQPSKYRKLYY